MRRVHALALAACVVLAGCPATTGDGGTVTPAPVATPPSPTPSPSSTPSPAPVTCAVPAPDSTPTTPTPTPPESPVAIPTENGTVDATALVERHDRTLRNTSYNLSSPELSVQADPGAGALRVHVRKSLTASRQYVVDGWRYTYNYRQGGINRYRVTEHDDESFRRGFGSVFSTTGSHWLSDALAVGEHRVAERRDDGWAVLRAEAPTATDDDRTVRSLDSTVLVDDRGIVRSVEQHYVVENENATRTVNQSFAVTGVGTATVERPEWVCIAERAGHLEVPATPSA